MALEFITSMIQDMFNLVPPEYQLLFNLFVYTFFIAIYSVFIWKFYKFLAEKEILKLNLRQYNYSKYPGLEKFFAIVLYTIEYIIVLPFLVLFWFAILSLFLLFLSKAQSTEQILLISAAIIASTRIAAYINENLSKDIAKILPFTILAMFILGEDFSNLSVFLDRFSQIPALFNNILTFVIFIFAVEFILRGFYSISQLFGSVDLVAPSKE